MHNIDVFYEVQNDVTFCVYRPPSYASTTVLQEISVIYKQEQAYSTSVIL